MTPEDARRGLTRRKLLVGAASVAAGGAAIGIGLEQASGGGASEPQIPDVALGSQPAGLPSRQHAWTATLAVDPQGDSVPPRFDRLLLFDVNGTPTPAHARLLEASLRTLERRYKWGPSGLLFTAGWGPSYFERLLRVGSPIPQAKGLSDFELPSIDDYHLCLHFACNDEQRLAAVEAALLHGERLPGADGPLSISTALTWRETRTGFVGDGLPAAHQNTGGIPSGDPVAPSAPLFMGFKSGLRKNQATEDAVTIPSGPFAGGTTMQVSYMRLRLDSWYDGLSYRERVARMYAPQVTPEQVKQFTTDAESDPNLLGQAINHYGVIGHAQTSARARRHGKPLIIRRDFNTVDGGQAGLHFVSVQRSIADFVTTRNAMNASNAQLQNPGITDTVNNGINEFMFVLKRANYILPTRADRSFPLLRA
ncbi:MAG: Tat pathway signal protein [Solirubrobacteraceae bacterium]